MFTMRSYTSPAQRREGDHGPSVVKRAWWRGRATGTVMRRTLITNRARSMRRAMTEPEVMLWSRLRGRDSERPTFRRQHPFASMIFDFYCPSARLAVEVDGATHWDEAAVAKDEARDCWLAKQGIGVHRIPASRIYHDLGGAVADVFRHVEERIRLKAMCEPLAPSTTGSALRSADGSPPAASRGR